MKEYDVTNAVRLSWKMVAGMAEKELTKILGREIKCTAQLYGKAFWNVQFPNDRIPLEELDVILDALQATKEQREDSIPPVEDHQTYVDGLGMDASELLIYRFMGYQAERVALFQDELWLLGRKEKNVTIDVEQDAPMEWIVVATMNGKRCAACGEIINEFQPGTCWFTTGGLVQFGHLELEMVVQLMPEYIAAILNAFGRLVKAGRKLKDGDVVQFEGIASLFHIKEFKVDGKKVLRVIVPDKNGRYPEEKDCEYPFSMQMKPLDELCKQSECKCRNGKQQDIGNN